MKEYSGVPRWAVIFSDLIIIWSGKYTKKYRRVLFESQNQSFSETEQPLGGSSSWIAAEVAESAIRDYKKTE